MRILVNTKVEDEERLVNIFKNGGYERNNLVFVHDFEEFKTFVENHLIKNQAELDLIITNNNFVGNNPFKAEALVFLKNSVSKSYSHGEFRISSIPVILYSEAENKYDLQGLGFDAIVKDRESHQHPYLIKVVEDVIRSWRQKVMTDLDVLDIKPGVYPFFQNKARELLYKQNFAHNYERTYISNTTVVSKEFIVNPTFLHYQWLQKNNTINYEAQIDSFGRIFRNHIKYDRKNNERTILHAHINDNRVLLKRGAFYDVKHELQFKEMEPGKKQICDFVLKTDMPQYVATTFFEVKKENVQLLANKHQKHPKLSEEINRYLDQVDDYQLYTEKSEYTDELTKKIGYQTNNYNFQLLAGRSEEKEEYMELFRLKLQRRYKGIEVLTFEDFENLNYTYLEKLQKMQVFK